MKTRLLLFLVFFTAAAVRTACAVPGDIFASVDGGGHNASGSIFQYTPAGAQSTFASGLARPRGLAFDGAGNLYVDTNFFDVSGNIQGTVLKFSGSGKQSTFATGFGTNFFLQAMAIDKSGDVFVDGGPGTLSSTVFKITPNGTKSTFFSSATELFGLAFDHTGNLFVASDGATTDKILKFTPGGTESVFASSTTVGFTGLAFDSAGDLFAAAFNGSGTAGSDTILKFTSSGVESTFASGLTNARGLAFDDAGNLFAAEFTTVSTGDILKFTPGGTESVFASGVSGPTWLAVQPRSVPDTSPTSILLVLGVGATFGLNLLLHRRSEA